MLFVHDVIARFEFHQVDGLAAAFRRFRLSCGGCAAGQVAFGEQGDFRGVVHETVDGARSDAIEIRDAGFVDRTLQSGECALGRGRDRHRIAGVEQSFDAGGRFVFVTAVFTGFGGIKLDVAFPGGVDAEAGEFPHVMFGEDECGDGFLEIVEIRLVEGDRRSGAMSGCGDMPACGKEFVGGFRQIVGGATKFFRVGQHDQRMLGQHALHRFHIVDQRGQQRFHAFHRDALAMDSSMSSALGMEPISDFARWRIWSVNCSSRHGVAHTVEISLP